MLHFTYIYVAGLAVTANVPAALNVGPVPTHEATEQEEIIVIGQKLSGWRGKTTMRNGRRVCKIIRSSKDKMVDEIGCNAMLYCQRVLWPKAEQMAQSAKTKKEAATLLVPYFEELGVCVGKQRALYISELTRSGR